MNTPSLVTAGLNALQDQEGTTTGRRQFLKITGSGVAALGLMSATAGEVFAAAPPKSTPLSEALRSTMFEPAQDAAAPSTNA